MSNSDVSKQILMICSTVRIWVLVTGQEQILTINVTGHFDRRPIGRYFEPCILRRFFSGYSSFYLLL